MPDSKPSRTSDAPSASKTRPPSTESPGAPRTANSNDVPAKRASASRPAHSGPRLRVLLGEAIAIGPGKATLLGIIDTTGSISGAARHYGMSYRRAWNLVDTMNQCFVTPLVETARGGGGGGGARLTPLGHEVLQRYRDMEQRARHALADDLAAFEPLLRPQQPDTD